MIATLVGSRNITPYISNLCNIIGERLSDSGFIARSGGASGCDTEFLRYYKKEQTEVYVPWKGFGEGISLDELDKESAIEILKTIVDISDLKESVIKLYTRNVFQVLGRDLNNPSDVLLYYAPVINSVPVGGTRIAYLIARKYNVECIHISKYDHLIQNNRLVI